MIYWNLFLGFLRVGCFSFGGAYFAIPLIRDVALSYGWLSEDALTYMIAVAESTPGPIMVNLATYVGASQAGIPGALCATAAVVLPAFVIILLISAVMKKLLDNPYVQAVLRGLKPCVTGIILATGLYMAVKALFPSGPAFAAAPGLRECVITAVLALAMFGAKPIFRRKLSSISLIVLSAVLGMVVYGI